MDYQSRCDKLEEELKMPEPPKPDVSQGGPSSPVPVLPAEDPISPHEKEQPEERAPETPDTIQKEEVNLDNEKDKTAAMSQNGGESVKTDTPNGKVSTSDMQETCNSGDNCELESDDALKSNGDVPSHQQAECEEGQEVTKL